MAECDFCGAEVTMPYTCGYCGGSFCPKHRLPENHDCSGLDELNEKSRREGRIYRGVSEDLKSKKSEEGEGEVGKFTTGPFDFRGGGEEDRYRSAREPSQGVGGLEFLKNFFFSDMTSKLLLVIVLVYFGQLIAQVLLGSGYNEFIMYLAPTQSTFLSKPWTLVTSIFIHSTQNPFHIIFNGIILFFIGSALERRIGSTKFLYLFLVSGTIASLAQVIVTPPEYIVLGASGAILGILGALTVLAPRMPVLLFFFLPMQLWMVTVGYGAIEVILAFLKSGGMMDKVGHVAHFVGLAIGALYGYKLRRNNEQRYKNLFESLMDKYGR